MRIIHVGSLIMFYLQRGCSGRSYTLDWLDLGPPNGRTKVGAPDWPRITRRRVQRVYHGSPWWIRGSSGIDQWRCVDATRGSRTTLHFTVAWQPLFCSYIYLSFVTYVVRKSDHRQYSNGHTSP